MFFIPVPDSEDSNDYITDFEQFQKENDLHWKRVEETYLELGEQRGIKIGEQRGLKKGKELGYKEVEAKIFENQRITIKNSIKMGFTIEVIAAILGISIQNVQKIVDELKANGEI